MKDWVLPNHPDDYMSIQQTTSLKGLLALGVLSAHVVPASGVVSGSVLSPLISSLGYLCVSVFFFLSGYGIVAQYQRKKEQYLKDFLKNRVLSIYLLTVFLVIIYGLFHAVSGNEYSVGLVLHSLVFGNTIVSNGWYLQVILLFYLLWFLCIRYIDDSRMQFVTLCVAIIAYMGVCAIFLPSTWYECSLCFLLGVFWSNNKKRIDSKITQSKKGFVLCAIVALSIFALTFVLSNKNILPQHQILNMVIRSIARYLSSPAFVVVVLLCLSKVNWAEIKVLWFLGKRSVEIYVLQGIALSLFKSKFCYSANGWIYILCVMITTMVLAVTMHPVIQFIMNIPKKIQWEKKNGYKK